MKRNITSILMLLVFIVLSISGVLSFFTEYTRRIATVHTTFGIIFLIFSGIHIINNNRALQTYFKSWKALTLLVGVSLVFYFSISDSSVLNRVMDFGAKSKVKNGVDMESDVKELINMNLGKSGQMSLDLKRSTHFWHPQIAIWTEDTVGNYIETLYVTKATAKGIFSGGRTKDNFKSLDSEKGNENEAYKRVNALPVWSVKRGVIYEDGQYAPTYRRPLPDAITGATPIDNFLLNSSVDTSGIIVVKLEINVAFDDNEYYSEYDFPDDEIFHNGTGQLGQPSIVYRTQIDAKMDKSYHLMEIEGHGHHSGKDGKISYDLSKLTTALELIEYIIVGYNKQV